MEIKPVAYIRTEFPEKFGVPRQSGLAKGLRGVVIFEKEFRNPKALRGLEGFSHLWLIWEFSANRTAPKSQTPNGDTALQWSPTVRPPRLGGNMHMGVFATRSPFRPNPLGLSCVEILSVEPNTDQGPVIYVAGADLMDGTPIYDIKPYIKYADSHPDALCGYVDELKEGGLKVMIPSGLKERIGDEKTIAALVEVLQLDPRPSYHNDPHREYGMSFAGYNVRFIVHGDILEVVEIQ